MRYSITEIEGIGAANAKRLAKAGIRSTGSLLKTCCDRKGRNGVSAETGIDAKRLLQWANHADLMRVRGIGGQFSELLEAAGVDTVKELRHRNPGNTAVKMAEIFRKKRITRRCPSESMVADWVAQAKKLDPVITH